MLHGQVGAHAMDGSVSAEQFGMLHELMIMEVVPGIIDGYRSAIADVQQSVVRWSDCDASAAIHGETPSVLAVQYIIGYNRQIAFEMERLPRILEVKSDAVLGGFRRR